jgi:hypothetical protein
MRKNTRRDLRAALDRAGYDWATSHNFRKTTATLLDEAGLSARVIADQLGHARPSLTQDVYMGRKAVDVRAAEALEMALGGAASPTLDVGADEQNEAKVSVAALPGGKTATLQVCDLHLWCAVRESNPQPAD